MTRAADTLSYLLACLQTQDCAVTFDFGLTLALFIIINIIIRNLYSSQIQAKLESEALV